MRVYTEANRLKLDVGFQIAMGNGEKAMGDGGQGQMGWWKRRGRNDRGEQTNTFLIKEGWKFLKKCLEAQICAKVH